MREPTSPYARHDKCAPFACNGVLQIHVEPNPMRREGRDDVLVSERCTGCGRVVNVWGVMPEPKLA